MPKSQEEEPKTNALDGMEDSMITCKLCGTSLGRTQLRRDGSMLCPECGQIYWKAAVDKAVSTSLPVYSTKEIETRYIRESMKSTELIRRVRVA